MKVLTIREPWASLIINGFKEYEFRNWKTNYRGKILIHAGSLENDMVDKFRDYNLTYNMGYIIGEIELVDSILVDTLFNEKLRKKDIVVYGGSNHTEKYAWKLENIKKYDKPIPVKGSLGLWNYYNELEIMDLMKNIKYGWVDKKNNKHSVVDETYSDNYVLQSPKEIIENKVGVCWDQVELERYYFQGWNTKTYFIVHYDNEKCPTHTFLTFEKNNKYYWFEHSWEKFRGIYEYTPLKDLLLDVRNKFIKYELNNIYKKENLCIYDYKKPKYHLSVLEFYKHCESGINISLEDR